MESVTFQIPAGYGDLRIADKALQKLLILHEVKPDVIQDSKHALQELLTSIVDTAYNTNTDTMIDLRFRVTGKNLFIEVKDNGSPAYASAGGDAYSNGYDPGALMDEVQYQYKDNRNMWLLVKYF
ncbi:MAG: ATP-binding protein [Anaerolineales bacterium]|nr:ATP-binding protein [Anaerolineales bacterium]MBP6209742.1 ATP-binding protein [Anaerolineales bacterium]